MVSTQFRIAALLLLLLPAASSAAGEQTLFRLDPGAPAGVHPWAQEIGDTRVAGGALRSTTLTGWARSGLRVGPLPVPSGSLILEYDFCPRALGQQSHEFASESPSTHWYMLFADAAGRWHLHTRQGGQWSQRHVSQKASRVGTWYHARVVLQRAAITATLTERDTGEILCTFPETPVDDIGDETAFILCDEGPAAGAGQTDWGPLSVSTDDPSVKARLDAITRERERERLAGERQRQSAERLRRLGVALVPMPQRVDLGRGSIRLGRNPTLALPAALRASGQCVSRALKERLGLDARPIAKGQASIRLASLPPGMLTPAQAAQGYRLVSGPGGVRIEAATPEGFYYGAQTLAQLIRPDGSVPAATVTDWPAIPNRLVMVAVSQGGFQVIDVDYWKRMIRELSAAKINWIMPYFEGGTCYYGKYPFLGVKGRDGFTGDKARLLSAYARQHFVRMVPQQEALGHSGNVLCHEELKDLREDGGVFCSSRPQVFVFLGDLFDELVAAYPESEYIHVGGDEFGHGFAKCPECKARAEAIGKPGLYAEHLGKLQALLKARKRKMMIWWHEEGFTEQAADRLSKEIVVFDWHYGNQPSYPSLDRLQKLGFRQTWAAPAVTRYYDGRDDFDNTFGNIGGFLKAAAHAGVPGECTCTWVHGIWGGRNLFELNYYALLYSGQCAWNPDWEDTTDFQWRYARHWFGLSGADLAAEVVRAVHAPFGTAKEQGFWSDNRALEPMLAATPAQTAEELAKRPALVGEAEALLSLCTRANAVLDRWGARATRNRVTIDYLRHDVRIHETAARRILSIAQACELARKAEAAPPAGRAAILAPAAASLRQVIAGYGEVEAAFARSVHDAGGGDCGWGGWFPFVAKGGVLFRAKEGREMLSLLLQDLEGGQTGRLRR